MTFPPMWPPLSRQRQALALLLSLALHLLAFMAVQPQRYESRRLSVEDEILVLEVAPLPVEAARPEPMAEAPNLAAAPGLAVASTPDRQPAFMAAPPAPTAQEWALASAYKLKNSKRYRYTWGQQVRSMMGTAYEGVDQGLVRFRIEIAPDGRLTRLETLWSTSETAERLARQAVQTMPPLPPTPTGQPLIFEQTISFQPFDAGGPPIYKNDCLPDPPAFRKELSDQWKQPVIIENKAGAATFIGAEAVARSEADGYAIECCREVKYCNRGNSEESEIRTGASCLEGNDCGRWIAQRI
jgi:TonB family protein